MRNSTKALALSVLFVAGLATGPSLSIEKSKNLDRPGSMMGQNGMSGMGEMDGMMKMMSQMGPMMEACNEMMQTMMNQPDSEADKPKE